MVLLSLSPLNGNHSRGWPFHGVFGLTPVTTHGTLRTRLGDDGNPVLASSIAVHIRCYEARLNKLGGATRTNILVERSQTLWTPADGDQYEPVGDMDLPFRFVLPADMPGQSTCSMPEYKVFWRIEGVITHVPTIGCGTRQVKAFDIKFIRHDSPASSSSFHVASGRYPSFAYSLTTPSHPVGPEDPIPVSLRVFPTYAAAHIVKVAVSIERKVDYRDPKSPSKRDRDAAPLPTPPSTASSTSSSSADEQTPSSPAPLSASTSSSPSKGKGKAKETNFDLFKPSKKSNWLFSSNSSDNDFAFNPPSQHNVVKTSTSTVVNVERPRGDVIVGQDEHGATRWALDSTLALPAAKPGHWATGETMSSPLVGIRFAIGVKVTLMTPSTGSSSSLSSTSSSCGTEVVSLPPQELTVVAISAARRKHLLSKLTTAKAASSSSSSTVHARPPTSPTVVRRVLRRTTSRRHLTIHPSAPQSQSQSIASSKSKKRTRASDPLPSPLSPSLSPNPSATSITPLLPPRIIIPPNDAPLKRVSSKATTAFSSDDDSSDPDGDPAYMLTGDLSFRRIPRRRPAPPPTSPRSPKSPRTSMSHFSLNYLGRPSTADVQSIHSASERSSQREFQRASSVGAVPPTPVLMLAERMGGLMDAVEEESPFSFSPPPAIVVSPGSSGSDVTVRGAPPMDIEREWEEELGRIDRSARRFSASPDKKKRR